MANATAKYDGDLMANYYKGTTPAAPPVTWYVALLTTNPTKNDGTGLVECSDTGYARQPITAATGWSGISTDADNIHEDISNANPLTWPAAAAGYTVTGLAVYDALSAGNFRRWGAVTPQAVASGNQYQVSAGSLKLEF